MAKKANPNTCEKCPNKYSKDGCPCWLDKEAGFVETNTQTGEERFITGCFYQVIPKLMVEVIKASNRPAAAVESVRNEMSDGFSKVAQVLIQMPQMSQVKQQMEADKNRQEQLEHNTDETEGEE